ncbi:MAG: ABC transporter ATP-binding protein [Acidobacteria bacterium]|nr:MAG: ABC transporter ATP-binding protein [Acidobacteriota bacterium]
MSVGVGRRSLRRVSPGPVEREEQMKAVIQRVVANLGGRTMLGEVVELVGPSVLARWKLCAGAALAVLAATVADLLRPWPLKFVFDYLLKDVSLLPGGIVLPLDARTWLLAFVCGLILFTWLLSSLAAYFGDFLSNRLAEELVFELRVGLFGHVQRLSLTYHDDRRIGDMLARVTRDTDSIRDLFGNTWLQWTVAGLTLAGTISVMLFLDWQLALVGALTIAALSPVQWRLRWRIKEAAKEKREREVEVSSLTQETIGSLRVVQAFGRETFQQQKFDRESAESVRAGIKAAQLEAKYVRSVDIISALATCAVVWLGVQKVFRGQLTAGDLYVFVHYVRGFHGPLRDVAKQSVRMARGRVGLERILEVVRTKAGTPDNPSARPAPALHGAIEFDDVSFAYRPEQPVLHHVSFKIEPGESVAVLGYTGAGKSSIVSLIPRLYEPTAGRVLIDGDDIRSYRLDSLREQIAMVLQESMLFQATILDNIRYGRPDAPIADILSAAPAARVDQFVTRLSDGYDTVVGPRGATLSGGERQRVAIARAMIRNPPILLLDEPTTGLDVENERLVMEALECLMYGKTTLIISHRLNLIERMDRVLVVDGGRIVETGTPAALRSAGGLYARLCDLAGASRPIDSLAPAAARRGGRGPQ